ncbi:DUF723 domain-containing protein [Photobacterium leiognathi]|uniref:DUF723 domain-containing protein n=1 Tax=Photobacterium leiognathi TaxID=553611 RepID=UPI002981DF5E|nr:DUF723 domain-containing protein [Photobacterium leiognathi]
MAQYLTQSIPELSTNSVNKTALFIAKAKAVWGDKFFYDKTEYIKSISPITITCREHGDFIHTPNRHLSGFNGCKKCTRITTGEFIKRANNIWGNRFDYSKVKYVTGSTKVTIICRDHGAFLQRPKHHLNGLCGCKKCSELAKDDINRERIKTKQKKEKISSTKEFIKRAKTVWGERFNYDNSIFKNAMSKITITCNDHGDFQQQVAAHLNGHLGCKKCRSAKVTITNKEYIERAKAAFGDTYDYSMTQYTGSNNKIVIICQQHGQFEQLPYNHLRGKCGCPSCSKGSTNSFIEKSKQVWGDRWDYSKTTFEKSRIKVVITCPLHGDFSQYPQNHLNKFVGCQLCRTKK